MNVFLQNVKIVEWRFRSEQFGVPRLRALQQVVPFSEIAARIAGEMTNIEFRPKEGDEEAKGKKRAEIFFHVGAETLDVFFNGAQGYRAQYYLDTQRGLECNRYLIDLLKGKLIEAANQSSQGVMTLEQIKTSLGCKSAKIWIYEVDSTLDQTSRDPEQIVALEIPRWMAAMKQVLAAWDAHQQPSPTIKTRALLGVQAPEGHRMEVLGAWLDDDDREFVVPSKLNRAQHIHEYGFS